MLRTLKLAFFSSCAIIATCFSGCLKDKDFDNGVIQSVHSASAQNIVEIALTTTSTDNFYFLSVNASSNDTTINLVPIRLASPSPASQDVHVTLKLDSTVLKSYNAANGTTYSLPPTSIYTIVNNVVTIPAGSNIGYLQVKFKSADFLNGGLAFPFSISSTDGGAIISGNSNTGVVAVAAKNKYDGIYSVISGFVQRYTAPGTPTSDALNGSVAGNPDLILSTVGANTVEITGLSWANSGGGVGGIANLQVTVDPVTNLVTMKALGNATLGNWAGHVNKYDPATKTFYLAFIWNPTSNVRTYETVIKYKGPR
jgi:hypothetical protein